MNSLVVLAVCVLVFAWGWRVYGRRLQKLYGIDPSLATPSKTKFDGLDYVPAKHWLVLFGHHFSSIAGAGPIVGPVIACTIWGWAPTLVWVVIGSVFFGAVHDFGALAISVKEGGDSLSSVAAKVISKRACYIFGIFVWLALLLVIAVFLYLCADTFVQEPKIILPSLGLIPVAMVVGYLLYVVKTNQTAVTVFGLGSLVVLLVAGQMLSPAGTSFSVWAVILLVYCFLASILPVNILLQPRDYLSSFLLFFGMAAGFAGLFITRPNMALPAFIGFNSKEGALWPMLFITVACGAISGFHSLIASGTSSKQIANERDIKKVGYGAMITEGLLAVMVVLAVAAGLGRAALGDSSGPIVIFGKAYGAVTLPFMGSYGQAIALIILNAFILTTLDTATRISRYLTEELFGIKNRFLSTGIIIVVSGWLALAKDAANTPLWKKLWPAFGASNQLVAALALFVMSCWLLFKNKPNKITLYPAIFMLVTTVAALFYQTNMYAKKGDVLLVLISSVLIVLAAVMTMEVVKIYRNKKPAAGL